jgi:hypothetical protein
MTDSRPGAWRFLAAALLVAAVAGGYFAYRSSRGSLGKFTYRPTTSPATQPDQGSQTQPATSPVIRRPTTTFIDVVRATYPKYTATQPLDQPVRELDEAARILLSDPVYVGPPYRSDLWVTRADGLSTAEALRRAMDPKEYPQVHVLPERVRFVHWNPGDNVWTPFVVSERADGTQEVVSISRRESLPSDRKYDWSRATSWNDKIVVPSESGVSIFQFEPRVTEDHHALMNPDEANTPHAPPQTLLDWQGLLAWIPAENGRRGGRGAARYVENKWTALKPEQGWPDQIVQLVPLRDGSVLQAIANPDGSVRLALATLYQADINEQAVATLVEQMSDPDAERREAAFRDLSQYGPGAFPILEKLAADQPPEARSRLRSLLRSQVQPTLGGMTLVGGRLQTVTRHRDGGVVFYAEGGVSIPQTDGVPSRRVPAWLSLRPGRAAEILDELFVNELKPDGCEIIAAGNNEWIVTGDAPGPRRWVGNGFVPILRKDEIGFSELLGIDRKGRWAMRKPGSESQTLILDPSLPDPVPRLPVWVYATGDAFGWDRQDWPTVRREGGDWSLRASGWKFLDVGKNEKLLSEPPLATSRPTTVESTTTQAVDIEPPLLVDESGSRYYDGVESLRVIDRNGKETVWPLPPSATGRGPATLLRARSGAFFLFNQPGRVLRIQATPGEAEPFTIAATFTRKIPNMEKPLRIWLDPAGRIAMVGNGKLVLLFPEGYIPPRIRDLMPIDQMLEP